jgi:hypothetical protein
MGLNIIAKVRGTSRPQILCLLLNVLNKFRLEFLVGLVALGLCCIEFLIYFAFYSLFVGDVMCTGFSEEISAAEVEAGILFELCGEKGVVYIRYNSVVVSILL